jgi:hypothetical protein
LEIAMRKIISVGNNGSHLTAWRQALLITLLSGWFTAGTHAAGTIGPRDFAMQMPAINVAPDIPTDQDNLVATFNYGCSGMLVVYGKTMAIHGNTIDIFTTISCAGLNREDGPDDHMDLGRFAGGAYQIRLYAQTKAMQYGMEGETVALAKNTFVVSGSPPPGAVNMSEFFHAGLNHYFVTADSTEDVQLRTLRGLGWQATGQQFAVLPIATPLQDSLQQVCRFYGSMTPGPNSHFFTADPAECAALMRQQELIPATSPRWNFEGRVLVVALPGQGGCPVEYPLAVRRFYNGRALQNDSNHRYVTSETIAASMRSAGWADEGVVMCGAQ